MKLHRRTDRLERRALKGAARLHTFRSERLIAAKHALENNNIGVGRFRWRAKAHKITVKTHKA